MNNNPLKKINLLNNKSERAMKTIEVSNYTIGKDHSPFIIAEMSGNHNYSFEKAVKIIEAV